MSGIDDDIATRPLETVTIELSRADAEAVTAAIGIAGDEMPWSEYEERWCRIAAQINEKLAQ